MKLTHLREHLLRPARELILNRPFSLGETRAQLLSLTEQAGELTLWLLWELERSERELQEERRQWPQLKTNREELAARLGQRTMPPPLEEISIQGTALPLSGCSSLPLEGQPAPLMALAHFLELGPDFGPLEELPLDRLALTKYHFREGTSFPEVDADAPLTLRLKTSERSHEEAVEPPLRFRLHLGDYPLDTPHTLPDPEGGEPVEFYIDRLILHDLLAETEAQFRNEAVQRAWREQGLDQSEIQRRRRETLELMARFCPPGQRLPLIEYENPQNVQLNFYTTAHLDAAPERSSGGAFLMFGSGDGQPTRHGHPLRTCQLPPVPEDFAGPIEVELFSWHRPIPAVELEL